MLARGAWVALPAALAADELADEAVSVLVGVQSGGGGGAMSSSVYYPVVLGVLTIEALVELWGLGEKRAADGTVRTTAAEEAEAAADAAASAAAAAPAAAPAQRAAIARRVTTLLRAERIASVLREQRDSERRSSWFTRMSAVRRDGAMG